MAAYQKLAKLAYRLHQKTIKGEIDWEVTVTDGVYLASFSDYSIKISVQPSQVVENSEDIRISVLGDDGKEIESFTDEDILSEWLEEFSGVDNSYKMMYETYETARRAALGTEQAINQILLELDDGEIPF